jgi:uncharacterized protein DUF4442
MMPMNNFRTAIAARKETDGKQSAVDPALAARSRKLRRGINFYPPYLGAGVRVACIADDFRHIEVEMPLRFYNRNYFGTHFGGSLYSMCDPFYVLMLANILGLTTSSGTKQQTSASKSPAKA